MMYKADERLAEIQENLRDVLAESGVRAVLDDEFGGPIILFKTADGLQRSPLKIQVLGALRKGAEPNWGDCRMEIVKVDEEKVGDNGWKYLSLAHAFKRDLVNDPVKALEQIGKELGTYPLVPDWNAPDVTTDHVFAAAYEYIKYKVDEHGGSAIHCERVDNVLRYVFTDNRDRTWHVTYKDDEAIVSVDDVIAEVFDAKDPVELMGYIGDVMFDVPRPG